MELKSGAEVLVKVRILRRASDNKPDAERGYVVVTSRNSEAYVQPKDIHFQFKDVKEEDKGK